MYLTDAAPKDYMSSGPGYPGEDVHTAMGENTAYSLTGHMLSGPAQGVSNGPQPGHGYGYEPVDQAERDAQHTAQTVAQDGPAFDYNQTAGNVRQAIRPGAFGATA